MTGPRGGPRTAIFFILSIFIGFSLVAQAKSADGLNLFVSKKTISDLEVSIQGEIADIENIRKRTGESRKKLEEYELIQDDVNADLRDRFEADLALYRALTASTKVRGPGITITLDDSPSETPEWADANAFIVHDTDILRIISELGKGGAEAITINGHRLYNGSTIYCNGYTVRINGEPEARPFIIKAIGDPANLSAAMIGPSSYGVMLKDFYGLVFRVQVETDIEAPPHPDRRISYTYARRAQGVAD
jgi:uncharacterized protein YlxW (UPF0749 family)